MMALAVRSACSFMCLLAPEQPGHFFPECATERDLPAVDWLAAQAVYQPPVVPLLLGASSLEARPHRFPYGLMSASEDSGDGPHIVQLVRAGYQPHLPGGSSQVLQSVRLALFPWGG